MFLIEYYLYPYFYLLIYFWMYIMFVFLEICVHNLILVLVFRSLLKLENCTSIISLIVLSQRSFFITFYILLFIHAFYPLNIHEYSFPILIITCCNIDRLGEANLIMILLLLPVPIIYHTYPVLIN